MAANGRRTAGRPATLTIQRILAWADAHHQRTGEWPNQYAGAIDASPGQTWRSVDGALRRGSRGLPGGSSLARLLARKRGVPNRLASPPLDISKILAWADAHHAKTGRWPTTKSGPVEGAPGETWSRIQAALRLGYRGLPGGSSIARLLGLERGIQPRAVVPRLLEASFHCEKTATSATCSRVP